jgi:hypothetical protein
MGGGIVSHDVADGNWLSTGRRVMDELSTGR